MTKCVYCGKREDTPVGYRRNFCDSCIPDKKIGVSTVIEKVFIEGYGLTEASRIKEMERRQILPYEREGGGYYLGRRGENNKVQEKEPSY